MLIEKETPKIITYNLVMDHDDKEYSSCRWAKFLLDYGTWRLTINSDVGDYSYCWGNNSLNDDFTDLLCRVETEYLLNKMSNKSLFQIEESKKGLIEFIEKYDYCEEIGLKDSKDWKEKKKEIMSIDNSISEESYYSQIISLLPKLDWDCVPIVKEYPSGAYIAIELFIKYIQPILRKDSNLIKLNLI